MSAVDPTAELQAQLDEANRQLVAQTDAARRAALRAERLQQFTAAQFDTMSELPLARLLIEKAVAAVGAHAGALALTRDDGAWELVHSLGYPEHLLERAAGLAEGTPFHRAVETGEPIWLDDGGGMAQSYPELAPVTEPTHRAWAVLPLHVEQRCIGVIGFSFEQPGPFPAEDRSFMQLLAQQCALALERSRLHGMGTRARVRAEFAERRLEFLAEASSRLAASLDYLATLASLARYCVPELGDWCHVHLLDDDGEPRLIAAVHVDPERVRAKRQLDERYPGHGLVLLGVRRVVETGQPFQLDVIDDAQLRHVAFDDEHFQALRQMHMSAQLTVPIVIDGAPCGTITLATAESMRRFDDNDVTLALELGRRSGHAVQNARLYQAVHFASEAKSDFLAVMSHELRTPLNAIIGYSDLLLLGVPDPITPRSLQQVERIRSASTSLLHLVEEVLSLSRIEAGKEDLRISPLDVAAIVRDCTLMVAPLVQEKQLELDVELPADPVRIVSDERKIGQIVTNLLSNAVKFTDHGTVRVSVERGGKEVTVVVADTGIGIPKEHLARIFDPFWQVEPASTRRFGGTGLGLGVARKLARLLEGRLEVSSVEGQGSTFTLRLPVHTPGLHRGDV